MAFSNLHNKTVMITGGSKGIGKEIAKAFAAEGCNIIITGRDEQALQETTKELKHFTERCYPLAMDVTDVRDITEKVAYIIEKVKTIDILVNNAGINITKQALAVTEEDWDRVLSTNLKGLFFVSQQVGKHMVAQKRGKIINIASQMSFVAYYDRAAYCASKGGAVQLTKALAIEWAKYNINVNAVAPTFIETELTKTTLTDETVKQDILARIPLGALSQPKDVTGAVLFLASDYANFVTGETLKVDGGWTAI